jgi:hypothetical protein
MYGSLIVRGPCSFLSRCGVILRIFVAKVIGRSSVNDRALLILTTTSQIANSVGDHHCCPCKVNREVSRSATKSHRDSDSTDFASRCVCPKFVRVSFTLFSRI